MSGGLVPSSQGTTNLGARHVDRPRQHKYVECDHSVEKDGCQFPPSHRLDELLITPSDSDVVYYSGECDICEEKKVLSDTIPSLIKKQIHMMIEGLPSLQHPEGNAQIELRDITRERSRKVLLATYRYKKQGREDESGESDTYSKRIGSLVYPARKLDGQKSHRWDALSIHMKFDSKFHVQVMKNDISDRLKMYEERWNEPNPPKQELNTETGGASYQDSYEDDLFDPFEEPEAMNILQEYVEDLEM